MIHKEGRLFLFIVFLALIALDVAAWYFLPSILYAVILIGSLILFIFFAQFFRNPKRKLTLNENAFVSPADGKVVVIEKVTENEYLKDERVQVSVFMSPLNVHLNRVPISGKLEYYKYHKGLYLVAFHPKSSELNERNTAVITTPKGTKFLMRQIAGAVARRICFYLKEGENVKQGDELGFIKFGSRMDIFLPLNAKINVEMGQAVKGGQTIIATF